ncbi:MAG TPA: phosphoglucosamine mutase [Ilumatobacter sp.]|nr:phosphoglucosamine mutase [Ilumatobacter sp.]
MKFGTDGVRGRANTELTAEVALRLGRAAARVLQPASAVVGGDSRVSTPMLEAAFVAGIASEGVDVVRLGVTPTPAVAFEAARTGSMGAVISASHNPYYDNGIKLFASGGTKLADDVEARIEAEMADLPAPTAEPGVVHGRRDPALYIAHLVGALEGRRFDGLHLVVDAANGAASHIVREVFEATGANVHVINAAPNGRNINDGCGATAPAALQHAVVDHGADVGIALDGDADRLIAVDERGNLVDGDHIIAILARDLDGRGKLNQRTVVATVMANLGFRLAMEASGITVVETKVGDRYVLEALARGFSLGGEQSGHVIFSDLATTGDGMLTALMLLDVVARSDHPLSKLTETSMTQLPQVLINIPVGVRRPDVAALLADEIAASEVELEGVGRVLVRCSGTEPLVRVMVEAPSAEQARTVAETLADAVRSNHTLRG